ncbi:hypothetical protein MKX01_035131, partial [Papaver californicum]
YRFFDLNNKVIIESIDADFFEDRFKSRNSGGSVPSVAPSTSSELRIKEPRIE